MTKTVVFTGIRKDGCGRDIWTKRSIRRYAKAILSCVTMFMSVVFLASQPATAANTYWNTATGKWEVVENWSSEQLPTTADNAYIDNGGTATIDATTGTASIDYIYVGSSSDSNGTVNVTGSGSELNSKRYFYIGSSGTGVLNLNAGGKATAGTILHLGSYSGSSGTVNVTGNGSELNSKSYFYIGSSGTGVLNLSDGGKATAGYYLYLGSSSGSSGTVNVTGSGSELNNKSYFYIGISGTGELNLSDGGNATSRAVIYLGSSSTGRGTVNVGSGSTLSGTNVYVGGDNNSSKGKGFIGGTGTVMADGGAGTVRVYDTLSAGDTPGVIGTLNIAGNLDLRGSTLIVDIDSNATQKADKIAVTGNVLFGSGVNTVTFTPNSANGVYDIVTTTTGTIANPTGKFKRITGIGADGYSYTRGSGIQLKSDDNKVLQLVLDNTKNTTLTWAGGISSNWHNTGTGDENWTDGIVAGETKFKNGDDVIFDHTAAQRNVVINPAGVSVGNMFVKNDYAFTGGMITASGIVDIDAGKSLGLSIADNAPALVADTVDFKTTGILNITGYTSNENEYPSATPVRVITTANGVQNFNPMTTTVAGQPGADFLSATASLGDGGNDVVVETKLMWHSNDSNRKAHGDFTIADGQTFTLGAVLADNSVSTNRREDWDGNSFTKQGTGTLILTSDNTYTGGTTINDGTLQIGNGSTTGSIIGDIANNAKLMFNRSDAITYDDVISGSGNLAQAGSGTLTLTGDNSYTGNTTISGGALTVTGSLGNGDYAGNIIHNGNALTFNQSQDQMISGQISGSGGMTKAGNSTLVLTGENSYAGGTTVTGGKLVAQHVNALGKGAVNINANTLDLDFDGTMNTGNVISGTGTVNILGDIDINHANTGFTGTASVVDDRRLTLGNQNALQNAAVVLGSGSILKTNQASDIRDLNSIGGILDLNGDLNVAGRASLTDTDYHVALAYDGMTASTDKLLRAKTIDITGGTLDVDSADVDANKLVSGQSVRFTVMESTGGLTGRFGEVTGTNKLFSLTQGSNDFNLFVDLQYASETPFSLYGDNHNTGKVADVLNWAAEGNPGFIRRLIGMNDTQINAWLDGARGNEMVAEGMAMSLHSPWRHTWSRLGIGRAITNDSSRGWAAGIARDSDVSSDGNARSYETYRRGIVAGYDHMVTDDVLLGAQMLYADDVLDSAGNRLEGDDLTFAVYASAWMGDWLRADGFAGYGIQDYGYRRFDASGRHDGQYDGRSMYGSLQFSTPLVIASNVTVGPVLGIDYQRTKVDSITERGTTDGQLISESDHDILTARIGVATQVLVADRIQWKGQLNYGRHIDGDNRPEISSQFATLTGAPDMKLRGVNLGREYVETSAGIEVFVDSKKHLSAFGDYEYRHAGRENSHGGRFGAMLRW